MKGMFINAVIFIVLSVCISRADRFADSWYDGKAEISTYRISEARYGQAREGVRVMVFVTEPMRLATHIKPDVKLPDSEKVRVIKLNDIRKFNTGVYDYSVMTSVFASVENRAGIPMMGTMKVAFTSQEWCGTVFEELLRENGSYTNRIHSYFESEGTNTFRLPAGDTVETEDNLWIRVRVLRGKELKPGESVKIAYIPSSWSRRKNHLRPEIVRGTLVKGNMRPHRTALGDFDAHAFTWIAGANKTIVWVEARYPHRILSWSEPYGSTGSIVASTRQTYWKENGTGDEGLRNVLLLPDNRVRENRE